MAIRAIKALALTAVEVISKNDDALDLENSDWDEYLKTGDVNHLKFLEGKMPTVFVCNFELNKKEAESLQNSMMGESGEGGAPKLTVGSWAFRVAQLTLKDIRNPEDVPENQKIKFKKDKNYAHDSVLMLLNKHGILMEIFNMYSSLNSQNEEKLNAKN